MVPTKMNAITFAHTSLRKDRHTLQTVFTGDLKPSRHCPTPSHQEWRRVSVQPFVDALEPQKPCVLQGGGPAQMQKIFSIRDFDGTPREN